MKITKQKLMEPNELIKSTGMDLKTLAQICNVSHSKMLNYSSERTYLPDDVREILERLSIFTSRLRQRNFKHLG